MGNSGRTDGSLPSLSPSMLLGVMLLFCSMTEAKEIRKVFAESGLPQGCIFERWTGSPSDLPFNQGEEQDGGKQGYRRDRCKLKGKMNAECYMGKQEEPTEDWGWHAALLKWVT